MAWKWEVFVPFARMPSTLLTPERQSEHDAFEVILRVGVGLEPHLDNAEDFKHDAGVDDDLAAEVDVEDAAGRQIRDGDRAAIALKRRHRRVHAHNAERRFRDGARKPP